MKKTIKALVFVSILFLVDVLLLQFIKAHSDLVFSYYPAEIVSLIRPLLESVTIPVLFVIYMASIGDILLAGAIIAFIRKRLHPLG
jgi:hypothetical protein